MRKKFSEMTQKELREARNSLLKYLREETSLHPTRISGLTDDSVFIEGGTFPATYNHSTMTLSVWGRGSRYAGGSMSIAELKKVEDRCVAWFITYKPEEEA